jgi:hypothetical protein
MDAAFAEGCAKAQTCGTMLLLTASAEPFFPNGVSMRGGLQK